MQLRPDQIERRQRRLARRGRLITGAKVVLPLAAILLITAIFLTGRERGTVADLFSAEELARLGAGMKLENPRLAGVTDDDQPFELTATEAVPDGPMAEQVSLDRPAGHIDTAERTVRASAAAGLLNRPANRLELSGGVSVETSDGWRGKTDALSFDLARRSASSAGAVSATGPNGELEAGSFRAESDTGDGAGPTIWFENGVRVLFIPPGDG